MEKRIVEVVLQGRRFTLKTEENEETFREIVKFANDRLDEIATQTGMPAQSVALLTVLSLAQELWKEREAMRSLRERIRVKSSLILDMLDNAARTESGDGPPL